LDTVPNIRQSDHCTDDAEFFQQNGDNSGEDDAVHTVEEEEEAAPHQANMRSKNHPRSSPISILIQSIAISFQPTDYLSTLAENARQTPPFVIVTDDEMSPEMERREGTSR